VRDEWYFKNYIGNFYRLKAFSMNIPSENADTSNEKEEERVGYILKNDLNPFPLQGPLALSLWKSESVSKFNLKDKMMRRIRWDNIKWSKMFWKSI